ncbi:MAG: glycosyl hydrolase family 28-related protein [Planctomycetota bacterium]
MSSTQYVPVSFELLESRVLLSGAFAPTSEPIDFPVDAGVIDATDWSANSTLNAIPDDGLDDTAALQAVLDAYARAGRVIYLPDGQYDLSSTLEFKGIGTNVAARTFFQGESRDGTILRLADNSGLAGPVLLTGDSVAQHFRNSVQNLTIDIGAGNPDATGLAFNASNQGTAKNLLIRSGDGQGAIGLDLSHADEIGPLLVDNVEVIGFDYGIQSEFQTNSKVLKNITVRDQNLAGLLNYNSSIITVEGFKSVNNVPAVLNARPSGSTLPSNGRIVMVDSELIGTGGASSQAAIVAGSNNFKPKVYLRDVQVSGYDQAVANGLEFTTKVGNVSLPNIDVDEYWFAGALSNRRGGTFELFEDSPDTMLGLAAVATPDVVHDPLSQWAGPQDFGASPGDGNDDTAALQAAIDSGATTVYLPYGDWQIDGRVELRGNTQRLVGVGGRIFSASETGKIVLGDSGPATVTVDQIENFDPAGGSTVSFEHDSNRTWSFRNFLGFDYTPTAAAPGDLFLTDVAAIAVNAEQVTFRNQNVYATQLNIETEAGATDSSLPDEKILNDGATVRILGLKIERPGTIVRTINGGKTELLSVYFNGSGVSGAADPAFVTVESALSVAQFTSPPGTPYSVIAEETRNGITRTTSDFDPADVYSAFDDAALWNVRQEVIVDNADTDGFSVNAQADWGTAAPFNGGFIGSDIRYSDTVGAEATFDPGLSTAGEYEVYLRWTNDRGSGASNGHASNTPVYVKLADGTEQRLEINQDATESGGYWQSLGTFDLDAASTVRLAVEAETNGKVIVDGVRLQLIQADQGDQGGDPGDQGGNNTNDNIFATGQTISFNNTLYDRWLDADGRKQDYRVDTRPSTGTTDVKWQVINEGNGIYRFESQQYSNRYLASGTPEEVTTVNNNTGATRWSLVGNAGQYQLQNVATGEFLRLNGGSFDIDLTANSNDNGTRWDIIVI